MKNNCRQILALYYIIILELIMNIVNFVQQFIPNHQNQERSDEIRERIDELKDLFESPAIPVGSIFQFIDPSDTRKLSHGVATLTPYDKGPWNVSQLVQSLTKDTYVTRESLPAVVGDTDTWVKDHYAQIILPDGDVITDESQLQERES